MADCKSNPKWKVYEDIPYGDNAELMKYSSIRYYTDGNVDELPVRNFDLSVKCISPDNNIFSQIKDLVGAIDKIDDANAIYVKPADKFVKKSTEINYCYFGGNGNAAARKKAVVSLLVAVGQGVADVVAGAVCAGTAGLGCAVAVAALPGIYFFSGVVEAGFYQSIDRDYYWPYNPDINNR